MRQVPIPNEHLKIKQKTRRNEYPKLVQQSKKLGQSK